MRRPGHELTAAEPASSDGAELTDQFVGHVELACQVYQFDYAGDPKNIVIDMTKAHIWDASTVATLDAITTKYEAKGKTVTIIGMNDDSAARHERLAWNLGAGH